MQVDGQRLHDCSSARPLQLPLEVSIIELHQVRFLPSVPLELVQHPCRSSLSSWDKPVEPVRPRFGSFGKSAAVSGEKDAMKKDINLSMKSALVTPSTLSKAFNKEPTPQTFSNANGSSVVDSDKVIAYNTGTGKMGLVERQSRSYASVVSDGAGRFKMAGGASARLVPRAEYDFEQANARLQKETISAPVSTALKETFYDRSASFFDNISCDATGGKEGKLEKNERKWNIETFGVAAPSGPHHYHHYNRGGGYRRGGGGYYRGGGYHRGGARGDTRQQHVEHQSAR